MEIESKNYKGYRILNVKEDIGLSSDLREIKELVLECIQQNEVNFALSFTKNSYLSAECIAILIGCLEMIQEKGGELSIINPNEDIVSILKILSIDNIVKTFQSMEELVNS